MIPGPDQIVACPHCKGLAKYTTLTSGNTFGTRVWTDGKQVAPMLPRPPAVVKCRHCTDYYWLADAKEVGTVDLWGGIGQQVDPAWTAAQEIQELSADEYYQAIEKGLGVDSQQERFLRVLAWWRTNDAFRDAPEAQALSVATTSAKCRKNLEALACLLDEADENYCLMRAEVLRERGEFESAKRVMNRVTSAEYATVIRQLRSLCDTGDTSVRELK